MQLHFHFPIEFLRLSNIDEVPGAINLFYYGDNFVFEKRSVGIPFHTEDVLSMKSFPCIP
jgi:hypothetical protein